MWRLTDLLFGDSGGFALVLDEHGLALLLCLERFDIGEVIVVDVMVRQVCREDFV